MTTMFRRTVLTNLCFLCLSAMLPAQEQGTVRGTIRDGKSGESLIGAYVRLKKDFSVGTVSDQEGRYSLALDPGSYTLVISFIGMETDSFQVKLAAGDVAERNIVLQPISSEMDAVEI